MWHRIIIAAGSLAGCTGVALGALTAHKFSAQLDAHALASLRSANLYLLIHALLLVVIGVWLRAAPSGVMLRIAGALCVTGIVCFCGGLALSAISSNAAFARAAPAGGLAFMAAWLSLAAAAISD
jgi:uncharacterized membrane protein YgdD (TMEM256/DUF423 family)